MKVKPMGMLLMMLAGWINRHQQDVIIYLKEENKVLREKLGTKRILLNDSQRMRLARLAKRLGRSVLADACGVFSPDTLLKWHRNLIARKYDGSKKKSTPGRKRISEEVEQLIIQIARKNKTWGSRRIKGQLTGTHRQPANNSDRHASRIRMDIPPELLIGHSGHYQPAMFVPAAKHLGRTRR